MKLQSTAQTEPYRLITLRDGARALLGALRPEHAPLLVEGFDQLSMRSRRMRFFTPKARLSRWEVEYLTRVDGQRHVAIGALVRADDRWHGAAVARFVELEPGVAEPAVTVVDAFQGNGLGGRLYAELVEAARSRGFHTFRAAVLPENRAMLRVFERAGGEMRVRRAPDALEVELALAERGASGVFWAHDLEPLSRPA